MKYFIAINVRQATRKIMSVNLCNRITDASFLATSIFAAVFYVFTLLYSIVCSIVWVFHVHNLLKLTNCCHTHFQMIKPEVDAYL